MPSPSAVPIAETVIWCSLALIGVAALVALISPKRFRKLSSRSDTWIDLNKALSGLDKTIDIDHLMMPYARWLGAAAILSVGAIGYFFLQYVS